MKPHPLICLPLVSMALVALAASAHGQTFPWDPVSAHYRILPRLSVLTQTGGFAGVQIRMKMTGEFDFDITPTPLAVFPPVYAAQFVNPDIEAIHPQQDVTFDVDDFFDLVGEVGGQTLLPRRPNLFHFNGETDDGSSYNLHVLRLGPWLYLRGSTQPPENTADYFQYHLRAVARRAPLADLNDDGVVDAADLRQWASTHGDGLNFLEWQRQLGEQAPTIEAFDAELNAALTAAASAMPEPGACVLVCLAGGVLLGAARRR